MSQHFSLAVVGAGPGGYIAALKAAHLGATVAVIEREHLGGTCLNNGCIPSKTLLASAELLHRISSAGQWGVRISGDVSVDWAAIQTRKDGVIKNLRRGIQSLLDASKVARFTGEAVLNGPGRIVIQGASGAEELTADKIVLATGSKPATLRGWPEDPERICSSDQALHWQTLPQSLLIVGGGVIGCEFACMMQALGVHVSLVEMMPGLLPEMDEQLGAELQRALVRRGVKIFTDTRVEALSLNEKGCVAVLTDGTEIVAERTLVAVGRRADTETLGLASVGITTDRSFIHVNDLMETTTKGIYCIGDANGRCLLAHAASAQGVAAVENALGANKPFADPIPAAVYTFPEIASVGYTEQQARKKEIPLSIGQFPFSHLGKAMAVGETEGFVKVIRHRLTGEILGVHMIGHTVTESIATATTLLHQKINIRDAAAIVMAHPSMSEALKEAAQDSLGAALHLPPRKVLRVAVGVE